MEKVRLWGNRSLIPSKGLWSLHGVTPSFIDSTNMGHWGYKIHVMIMVCALKELPAGKRVETQANKCNKRSCGNALKEMIRVL